MTDEEFRADLLAAAASRAEVQSIGGREALVTEILERLRDAGEMPDTEPCAEMHTGQRGRKLEVDAWSEDDADGSFHLIVAMPSDGSGAVDTLTLSEARDQGFSRLLGVFEQAREGWLTANIEESRPLWALARRIQTSRLPSALRLHVVTDRPVSERLREIAGDVTRENLPITFQIWDITRLKRIHDARSVRDDLVVDFTGLPGGGLPVLRASVGTGDYDGYLAVVPGEALAEIYVRYGSRLLEGNVRTFLGRSGKVNKGIALTVANEPARFFAFNNGIAATASQVTTAAGKDGSTIVTSATDLQIVNGAQTTASLAVALRDGNLSPGTVFVPMKLSVVEPELGIELIPQISRFANSQNGVRPSDFFANHAFHRRIEECSRRILAPGVAGSQIQTHWYYERARGQHLNDQAGMTAARKKQFLLLNPRSQVVTKTDLAKVECCFNLEPHITCKGAEKAFVAFAERITKEWAVDARRSSYGDSWFKEAVARVILFRAAEAVISNAEWYEGGYRAQIVAYTCARLAKFASDRPSSGGLAYLKIWGTQAAGEVLERQIAIIAGAMASVLRSPPVGGQNISEWAKQPAGWENALRTPVTPVEGFDDWIVTTEETRAEERERRRVGGIDSDLEALTQVMTREKSYWEALRDFCRPKAMISPEAATALVRVCGASGSLPTDRQARALLRLAELAERGGWQAQ